MKRFWPLIIVFVGLFLLSSGFMYDVMFAGIPYQDPTPEMSARYAYHSRIAARICWLGIGVLLFGLCASVTCLMARRNKKTS